MFKWFRSLVKVYKREPLSEGSSSYSEEDKGMWLFVGLGNPGGEYSRNRHNVGFMVLDAFHNSFPVFGPYRNKFQGQVSEGHLENQKVMLLKPETFMNNSGQSVGKVAQFYKIEPGNVIVFHDELDLDANVVRVKRGGGNAGHNGLKSIQAHLGTADFWRVRIGIGRPEHKSAVSNYVLDNFSKAEQKWLVPLVELMGDKADVIIYENPKAYEKKVREENNGI